MKKRSISAAGFNTRAISLTRRLKISRPVKGENAIHIVNRSGLQGYLFEAAIKNLYIPVLLCALNRATTHVFSRIDTDKLHARSTITGQARQRSPCATAYIENELIVVSYDE
jgi:hypothetical protein